MLSLPPHWFHPDPGTRAVQIGNKQVTGSRLGQSFSWVLAAPASHCGFILHEPDTHSTSVPVTSASGGWVCGHICHNNIFFSVEIVDPFK